ncbi:MAG: EAL domain-containing protein [Magnetococcales bacterium]|nr:EAL domain-containing protein [Magnetococcales bacterium]MBF0149003.1 EAL domain-containing protein [Magnetococcales bacterium]MBF0172052.1 EAL domain-containing protein [Magnetococcales bacterium]MBF0346165.1 EAL domain-containing protein [Magnetococcales bacterium]MBF0630343.1 EAL domain-containing protein [Magnetococcales bacterium]
MKDEATLFEIMQGLDNNEFVLHYQPKISLLTGKIIGAEALIRWQRGSKMVPPVEFIPHCERTGFTPFLTKRVIHLLSDDIRKMLVDSETCNQLHFAVNVSGHDLKIDHLNLLLFGTQLEHKIDYHRLQFELTETVLSEMSTVSINRMKEFVNAGISLALDDFGTGFSSLSVLVTYPFSLIKLDKSIVDFVTRDNKADNISSANIRMAHRIGLRVVAEGIEDSATYNRLLLSGCDQGQGYFLSKPLERGEFVNLVNSSKKWPGKPIGLIYQAQMDHLQWRKDLLELYYCTEPDIIGMALGNFSHRNIRDHSTCNLGRWYFGDGLEYKDLQEFKAINQPHEMFHEIGYQLVELIRSDKSREDGLGLLRQLNILSSVIIGLLQDLEHAVYRMTTHSHYDTAMNP